MSILLVDYIRELKNTKNALTTEELYNELNHVNHSRENRLFYANLITHNHELISKLLEIMFRVNDKASSRAAWVFEFVCNQNIDLIIPYLDTFTKNIHKVHLDSAVRPVAKICEYIAKAFTAKTNNAIKQALTPLYKERIIALCFDYMINDEKVAAKAYSMSTLFLLGKDDAWVYPELTRILKEDYSKQSAAFKARARQILKKIKQK
ncbi:adenylosuccinate lyase [Oceanihabitans sp. IOP_32]|uniref:adenylosuccinate lyase n=1 Tax=Oceanihabitans sp. IOP_32 TaxID=2529032 RepID=UPI00293BFD9C|nr:adenylosuccinate lyase [Oceanihabitans sp. IOP_32]